MRTAILKEVQQIMRKNQQTYFLTGDLGYNSLEEIEKEFPTRFINVGVAEQNMIGIASGLALSGKKVYIYSIIPFLLMRCYEQIRNDVCYHDLDVTLLGIGAGLTYGILSSTHFALEDIAILRPLPNMNIFSPADETEAVLGIKAFATYKHPLYIRIGARQEPTVYSQSYEFEIGKGVVLQRGNDLVIYTSGTIIPEVKKAAELLDKNGLKATIVNIHTIKPLDEGLISKKAKDKKLAVVVEEHGIIGGLGSAVCEVLSSKNPEVKIIRIGVEDKVIKKVGTRDYLRKNLKLDFMGIQRKILSYFV